MFSSLGCLLLCGSVALALGNAQKLPKGKRPDLKVHINTTGDSVFLKFLRPNPNVKLEGFLLGYGSNVSPNQYFPLPTDGKYTEAVVDAEPKYLIVVRPAPPPSQKKSCSGKSRPRKPLQLVVGTLTPSSVFLSWGFLINPQHDWTLPSHCPNDRYYTIRYREKDKEKKWVFQLCPATETIVENLKPNTVYEFGVKDNVEGGIWSKIFNHKTIVRSKNKVNGKIQSTYDQVHTVPAYVPRRIIPVTIIKQVIQNITHRASTKSPDRTPFGGTILLHLVIPGLNETTVKLPTSLIFEISDALKTQLATNETLALPAESKTPQVEKIPAQPITVLSERTSETPQTVLIPRFELPLSTLAPKRLPEFPQAKTPFPFEKPGGTLASSEKLWIVPTSKTPEDSKVLPPQTATYDVFSRPATPDEREIAEPHTATSDPFLDSVPPKTSRALEQPRATLAPSETPSVPQKLETFASLEMQPTTPALLKTTSIPSTPKRRLRPKAPRTKPEGTTSPGTITSKISISSEPTWTTLAPSKTQFISLKPKIPFSPEVTHTKPATPKTKRPGRRPRPKATRRPDVPKSKPALEPATVQPELLVPTVASKPSKRPKTTRRPAVPQIQPDSIPPKQLLPKPKSTAKPDMPPTTSVFEPVTFGTETPSLTIVLATDEPVTPRTEAPWTTLAPKSPQRTRPRRPRPKHKTTPSPEAPQTKIDFTPVTPGTSLAPKKPTKRPRRPRPKPKTTPHPEVPQIKLVPATIFEPVTLRTEAPGTTLAPKVPQRPRLPRPKPKTTPRPEAPQTELVTPIKEAPGTTFVPVTDREPITLRTETFGTTLATKTSQRPRRPRPRPKTTRRPQVPPSKPVPATILEPVTVKPKALGTTLVLTPDLETVTFRTETWVTTQVVESITPVSEPPESTLAPKQIPRTPPKPKTPPRPRIPETQPAPKVPQRVTPRPKTFPSPEVSYTLPVPKDVLLPHKPDPEVSESESVLQPVTFRIHPPETTIAPLETRGSPFIPMISPSPSREELQTLAETDQSTQEPITTKIPQSTELAKTTRAPHRLYTTPVRPRLPDRPHIRPGVKQTPKPPGAVSVDSTHVTKKPATVPGTRRPPLPPRPSPPRRKPLPPNNVTGKPGSAGIVPSGRATSPPLRATLRPTEGPSERIEADKKQPTVPASGEDLGNTTDFSSSPTRETDPLGKPRFKGPHVRYIPKPDNRPCSITDSVKRFPKEEATEGNATSPPQNPPTNLTVVTVEGCPSFVILDWDKPLNDTVTEYEVISRENGSFSGKNKSIHTNQTFSTVENLKPDTSYEFQVKSKNPLGEGPASNTVAFSTESADPRVSEPIYAGRDAIWTERPFNSDSYSECKGKQYVKRTWYKKFVGVQLCNSLRYKIYLSDSLTGKFYNIGDQRGHGEDHCQFVDSFLDGRTGQQLTSDQLPTKEGYFRAVRQEPVQFGEIGGHTQINYVQWYECGTTIPGKW
ncbi:target of Nesh-SH3 isoform X24 [Manis pentadactyla]|uniref:target of Nesh-SH3 isoform X24 n=1 Tax=Manis pentadactyla TaxID=143292 RepID=UPI00255CAB54|nr:target of Nesh-SH3 isoform X24 [Manis pentadactyla]